MGVFGFLKKDKTASSAKKGFHQLAIANIEKLSNDTVRVTFDVPSELKKVFSFKAGQYLNFLLEINGEEIRRSYSICSGENEALAVAVKAIKNGIASNWFNSVAAVNDLLFVAAPEGNFILPANAKTVVAFAAGSGITPIVSLAKALQNNQGQMQLFYGNRSLENTLFKTDFENLSAVTTQYFFSQEQNEGAIAGRIDKETITNCIKADLALLKADAFFICGPEEMILAVVSTLEFFGVAKNKIHYELFTTPVLMKKEETVESNFKGTSAVKVILDSEVAEFSLANEGKTILEALEKAGLDAPFSCRGGVCCSCKAKVLKGSASMKMNYSLTDEEVKDGYILTCQAHPTSEELIVSFDE
jgi:ring-1,2-phenylacetyl-CoA epoxidase subunit PaaE